MYPILIDILAWLAYVLLSGYSSVSALFEQWFYYYDLKYSHYYLFTLSILNIDYKKW
jgi:hypothetical protein